MASRPPLSRPGLHGDSLPTFAFGSNDDVDASSLLDALQPANRAVRSMIAPAAHPTSGAMDVVTLRGIVLVAYAAAHGAEVVIARGADLGVLRRIRPAALCEDPVGEDVVDWAHGVRPSDAKPHAFCAAVAFRATDGALAAAFGKEVFIFQGWDERAKRRGRAFGSQWVLARLRFPGESDSTVDDDKCTSSTKEEPSTSGRIAALSWSREGNRLAAVGSGGMVVWELCHRPSGCKEINEAEAGRNTSRGRASSDSIDPSENQPASFRILAHVSSSNIPSAQLSMAALSPDGVLLAAAALQSRRGWVWQVGTARRGKGPAEFNVYRDGSETFQLPRAELTFGYSGVASMEWKPRGGGQPALMTVDRDGSLRLWAKIAHTRAALNISTAGLRTQQNSCSDGKSGEQLAMSTSLPGLCSRSPNTMEEKSAVAEDGNTLEYQLQGPSRSALSLENSHRQTATGSSSAIAEIACNDTTGSGYSDYNAPMSPTLLSYTWMEEIARGPHVEDTPQAGASFIHWGGGGGVADDESDASANAASHPFLADGAAPKPSRALHWIVRVAGGDVRAWKARGLDDRPRAEFARLEPGSGHALVGDSEHHLYESPEDSDSTSITASRTVFRESSSCDGYATLSDAFIYCTRAIAPIPLTTSSTKRMGLVKSYAISNGERRMRSPEPPEPPNVAAVFVLFAKSGLSHVARYDISPTSNARAACRACVGAGHSRPIVSLNVMEPHISVGRGDQSRSATLDMSATWVISRAEGGDTLLWRADPASPTREPLVLAARLPGPHTASCFAPYGLVSRRVMESTVSVFAIDSLRRSLHLYKVAFHAGSGTCSTVQNIGVAQHVASDSPDEMLSDTVRELTAVPVSLGSRADDIVQDSCYVIGFSEAGKLLSWRVTRRQSAPSLHFQRATIRVEGRRYGCVTALDTAVELGTMRRLVAVGSDDGCSRLYEVYGASGDACTTEEGAGSSATSGPPCKDDFWDGYEGNLHLREVVFLGQKNGSEAAIGHICIAPGGERVAVSRLDGSLAVWKRSCTVGSKEWHAVLSVPAFALDPPLEGCLSSGMVSGGGLYFGQGSSGQPVLFSSANGKSLRVFAKRHGTKWETVETEASTAVNGGPIVHIGLGLLVQGVREGLVAIDAGTRQGLRKGTIGGFASTGYSTSVDLMSHLLSGGRAWQIITMLTELGAHVERCSARTMSGRSYACGQGIVVPPPQLGVVLSNDDVNPNSIADDSGQSEEQVSNVSESAIDGLEQTGIGLVRRNRFAELMAKTEARFAAEEGKEGNVADEDADVQAGNLNVQVDSLQKLSRRLRRISLAGLSRVEQSVLAAVARAASSVNGILGSLDSPGARFALLASCYLEASPDHDVPSVAVASALHSSAGDALRRHFLVGQPSAKPVGMHMRQSGTSSSVSPRRSMWNKARRLGAGWWVCTQSGAKSLVEQIARVEFNETRNAETAALWYVALGRAKTLAALYKSQQDIRMYQFLNRNFEEEKNRIAARKNAYVLVSKHRLLLAASFFLLAGDFKGALNLVRTRIKDEQLAILLARVVSRGALLHDVLNEILVSPAVHVDPHRRSMTLWLLGQHTASLDVLSNSDDKLRTEPVDDDVLVALGADLPPAVLVAGHIEALADRPPIRGTPNARLAVVRSRERAMHALTAAGSAMAALRIGFELLGDRMNSNVDKEALSSSMVEKQSSALESGLLDMRSFSFGSIMPLSFSETRKMSSDDSCGTSSTGSKSVVYEHLSTRMAFVASHVRVTAAQALRHRSLSASGAVLCGASAHSLLTLVSNDLVALRRAPFGVVDCVRSACTAAGELSRGDEIDAACALVLAARRVANTEGISDESASTRIHPVEYVNAQLENVMYLATARCVFRSMCAVSPLHRPNISVDELCTLLLKCIGAVEMMRGSGNEEIARSIDVLSDAMKRAALAMSLSLSYLWGDWSAMLGVLRACEAPPTTLRVHVPKSLGETNPTAMARDDVDGEDRLSQKSSSSIPIPGAISLEGLRHIASNPAVLGISPHIGHRRRRRRAPSFALVDNEGGSSVAVMEEDAFPGKISGVSMDSSNPVDTIRAHPVLNSALGNAAISYLASHQASRAADLAVQTRLHTTQPVVRELTNVTRLLDVSESFEHVAADSLSGWIPFLRLGSSADSSSTSSTDEMVGAFVDLWSALGCLPEYAPNLSEAATVAAAELAASAAAQEVAAEVHSTSSGSARRRQRRLQRAQGLDGSGKISSRSPAAQRSLDLFDTTSADSLFNAYPVRFSSRASGPWSGRGRYATLYAERNSLFRTLCISTSDPPSVVVATPKGVQEVVPSSYTAMPTGFRAHYFAKKNAKRERRKGNEWCTDGSSSKTVSPRLSSRTGGKSGRDEGENQVQDNHVEALGFIETSFGEGPYMALDLGLRSEESSSLTASHTGESGTQRRTAWSRSRKDAVWRHQVEATALAAHPLRRRFVSGGTDGVIRLWDFGDPVSLGSLKSRSCGRVSALHYSAYGNALLAVHATGKVAIWRDPDTYWSYLSAEGRHSEERSDAQIVNAFHGRSANDGVFLDERFVFAVVGDPTAPVSVGHSLRVFDTREPESLFHPSWSAHVHGGGEARCIALLEDRVRVVTGGMDGSLTVVDLRMSRSATAGGGGMQARVAELLAHDDQVSCLATETPRGRALVTGSRDGDVKLWDSRTLLLLDHIECAHTRTRHYWGGSGIGGMIGSYGVQSVALTDRSLVTCGGDGIVKTWGPGHGWSTSDVNVV